VATVLRENERMLNLAKDLHFTFERHEEDPTVWALSLPLQ
jgi:hypothetical protein